MGLPLLRWWCLIALFGQGVAQGVICAIWFCAGAATACSLLN